MHEGELDKLAGMRLQLEVQVNTLESANINANTLDVMRRGATALKDIHNGLYVSPPPSSRHTSPRFFHILIASVFSFLTRHFSFFLVLAIFSNIDKVDATMNSINEQRDIANEISEAISNTANLGIEIDEVRIGGRERGERIHWLTETRWLVGRSQGRAWGTRAGRP
jgi:charged multivesicular body protein 4